MLRKLRPLSKFCLLICSTPYIHSRGTAIHVRREPTPISIEKEVQYEGTSLDLAIRPLRVGPTLIVVKVILVNTEEPSNCTGHRSLCHSGTWLKSKLGQGFCPPPGTLERKWAACHWRTLRHIVPTTLIGRWSAINVHRSCVRAHGLKSCAIWRQSSIPPWA